jgi:hypothetical protein
VAEGQGGLHSNNLSQERKKKKKTAVLLISVTFKVSISFIPAVIFVISLFLLIFGFGLCLFF